MKTPVFVRELTLEEQEQLEAGLRSKSAFTLKRCQILRASAQKQTVKQIVERFGFAQQTVRHVLHAFNERGLAALEERSHAPLTVQPVLTGKKENNCILFCTTVRVLTTKIAPPGRSNSLPKSPVSKV